MTARGFLQSEVPQESGGFLCIRVDIDTRADARALPDALKILNGLGARPTVFVSTGRDEAWKNLKGAGVFRLARQPRSLRGWRELLSAQILSVQHVEDEVADLRGAVFGLALHGYNHRHWVSSAANWRKEDLRENVMRGIESFRRRFGFIPSGFASPAFVSNKALHQVLVDLGFRYSSDVIGHNAEPSLQDGFVYFPVSFDSLDQLIWSRSAAEPIDAIRASIWRALRRQGYACVYFHPSSFVGRVAPLISILSPFVGKVSMPSMAELVPSVKG